MLNTFRAKIAQFLYPDIEAVIDFRARLLAPKVVKDEYQCQFFGAKTYPDDDLTDQEKADFELWANTTMKSPWFNHYMKWCMDIQGNFVLRQAQNERQADFGRATIKAFELFIDGVDRLSAAWNSRGKKPEEFDPFSTGIVD